MAFTERYIDPQRWSHFMFFATGGANGVISEGVAPGKIWKLHEIRVHFSTAFASTEYLVGRLSAARGSYYNVLLFSAAISGSTDIRYVYSDPLLFESGDVLYIGHSTKSGVNTTGITMIGWAALG